MTRAVRQIVRGYVLVVIACLVIATWGVRIVLTPDSGSFYALVAFMPILAAPGWLVFHQPRVRWLAVWAGVGWIATIAWLMVGFPYRSERAHASFEWIEIPLTIAICLVLFGAPIAMYLVAAHERRGHAVPPHLEKLARRLRSAAHIAIGCGAIVVAMSIVIAREPLSAFAVAVYVALLLAPGALELRDPQPKWALLWTLWSLPFALLAVVDTLSHSSISWQIAAAALGTMFVTLVVVLPIICFVTKRPLAGAEDLPEARVR